MAEVTETNELHTIIILKYKLLSKLYTNESLIKIPEGFLQVQFIRVHSFYLIFHSVSRYNIFVIPAPYIVSSA